MKVLVIAFEYYPILGGGGSYVKNLVFELLSQGVEIVLLTSGEEESRKTIDNGLEVQRHPEFQKMYFGKGNIIKATDIVVKEIAKIQPDLIHTHHTLETLIAESANANYHIPHVVTHHKTPEYRDKSYELNGKWSMFNYVNLQKPDKKQFISSSDAFVKSLENSGVDKGNIRKIYPGVNRKIFRKIKNKNTIESLRKRLGVSDRTILILIPAQIRERKGIGFAIKALQDLRVEDKEIKILITGLCSINQDEKDRLFNLTSSNKLLDIKEYFTDKEMPILYNIADLVILPSKAEGLGMALLEAMACETPVLGTNVMGINEVIEDGVNGVLIEFGDNKELVSKATNVLANKNTRNKLVKNALISLDAKFNLQLQAKKHIDFYKELVSSDTSVPDMNVSKLQFLLSGSKIYNNIFKDPGMLSLIVVGSIAGNNFIPGWSDIDLLCLVDKPRKSTLDAVSGLESWIAKKTKIKTGIEIFMLEQLEKAVQDSSISANYVKIFKNIYGTLSKENILYLKKGLIVPVFKDIHFQYRDLFAHTLSTFSYMQKYIKNGKNSQKETVRKIVKNSLFLMQSYLLFKRSELVKNYDQVLKEYTIENSNIDLSPIFKYYKMRDNWAMVKDQDISDIDLDACWETFSSIANINFRSKSR